MRISPSFIRFSIIGVANTATDVGIFSLLSYLGWSVFTANLLSTTVGLSLSFLLNHHFAFRSQGKKRQQIIPFLAVTLFGLWVLQPSIIYAVTHLISAEASTTLKTLAKLLATAVTLVWNYAWYSKKIFRSYAE